MPIVLVHVVVLTELCLQRPLILLVDHQALLGERVPAGQYLPEQPAGFFPADRLQCCKRRTVESADNITHRCTVVVFATIHGQGGDHQAKTALTLLDGVLDGAVKES